MTTLHLDVVALGSTRDGFSRLALDLLALEDPSEPCRTPRPLDRELVRALVDGDPEQQRSAARALARSLEAAA